MSMRDRSRGRSNDEASSDSLDSLARSLSHEVRPLRTFTELDVLLVRFVDQPMHVMPDVLWTVLN